MSTNIIQLKKFDMKAIPDSKKLLFIGGTGSGKSILVLDYLYYHQADFPIGSVISPTEELNETFKAHVPSIFIHNQYSPELIEHILKRQKDITKKQKNDYKYRNVDPRAFCIMDDCLADSHQWKNDPNIRWIFENGRHSRLTFILTLQFGLGIQPHLRANTQYVFLCRTAKYMEQYKLWQHFAGMFKTFKEFREVFIQCTKNYGCMVINNESLSDRLEDQVYWYRADIKSKPDWNTFRMCYPIFWKDNKKIIKYKQENSDKINKLAPQQSVNNDTYVIDDDGGDTQ
jgi:hypothetical protein